MSLLKVDNLSLGYNGNVVFRGLNFEVDDGDFICVVGPNGSGKTTLMKGILGLLHPMSGKIRFDELRQKFIGYMPQETLVDPNFPASVFEIVLSGTLNRDGGSFYGTEAKADAVSSLKILKCAQKPSMPLV